MAKKKKTAKKTKSATGRKPKASAKGKKPKVICEIPVPSELYAWLHQYPEPIQDIKAKFAFLNAKILAHGHHDINIVRITNADAPPECEDDYNPWDKICN